MSDPSSPAPDKAAPDTTSLTSTEPAEPSVKPSDTSTITDLETEGWSRVSPLAIVYFFAKTVVALVNNFIYLLPVFAFNYSKVTENPALVLSAGSGIMLLILIISAVRYWFYIYKFTNDRVEIKQGIFKKSHLDLPFKKIQNVKIVQPIYYRFKQYSYIELDTAGSAGQEAKIVALPLSLAERFKGLILHIKQEASVPDNDSQSATTSVHSEQEVLLNERSLKDLIIHGISNNRVWIFLGFLAPFYGNIGSGLDSFLSQMGFDLISYLDYESQSLGLFMLHVLSLVMLIMLLLVSFSVIGSIFVFYQYRLSKQGDRYIRRSGLLTKQEVSMRLSRIQIAVQQQDWLDILIKRTNLRFEQNTSIPAGNAQAGNINNASKLIVPSVTPIESMALIQDAFDVKRFSDIDFKPISKRFMVRISIFPLLPLLMTFCIVAFALGFSSLAWGVGLGINAFFAALMYLRWRRWGYYFDNRFVYLRKGLFGINYYVFPAGKTQQVRVKQSVFMRRHKLSSLQYVLASGALTVPFIPEHEAKSKADESLYVVAKFKPAWM